ncbi:MAG: hypothetical protein QUT30_07925 [Acidobacteriota bacterium]|nr:hypothetical protein [Acidobacteriota bacterium]
MRKLFLTLCITVGFVPLSLGQEAETIRKLFEDAIDAMGGERYRNVTDIVTEGTLYGFDAEGSSSLPIPYVDYTKFPDKSRFEMGSNKKKRDITVFNLGANEGWILEGDRETREAKPEEMEEFKNAVRHSIDMICRFRYKDPENRLFYLGPGEGNDVTLEQVKIVDPENDEVIVYFDRISKLPARIEYREVSANGIRLRHVEEFSQWHRKQGILTPLRIDRFVNGRKSSQNFILKITYNNNLADSLFTKPVRAK